MKNTSRFGGCRLDATADVIMDRWTRQCCDYLNDTETDGKSNPILYLPKAGATRTSASTVRTTRPEKCDIFAQRYQSQAITTKFQKTLLIFS